jgi:hypothetical protein
MISVGQMNQDFPSGSYWEKALYSPGASTIGHAQSCKRRIDGPESVLIDVRWSIVGDDMLELIALGHG